jgi:hypothetical protein
MTKCKWCGMDSRDEYTCEWCKKELKPRPPAPPPQLPVYSDPDLIQTPRPQDPGAIPSSPTFQSPPQTPPVSQAPDLHLPPPTAPVTTYARIVQPVEVPWSRRASRFLIVAVPMLIVGSIAMHLFRGNLGGYIAVLSIVQFISGITLPAFQVVGFFDDEYRDVFAGVLLTALLGPLLGGLAYGLVFGGLSSAMGLDYSKSVLALMGWTIISGTILHLAFFGIDPTLAIWDVLVAALSIGCGNIFTTLPLMAIYLGWFFGGFFRPLDRN